MAYAASPPQPGPRHRADAILDSILAEPGVEGAFLLSRDGLPVLSRCTAIASPETFAAMQAAALGAAEMAFEGVAGYRSLALVVDLGDRRFLSRGAGDSFILVAAVSADADLRRALERVTDACEALSKIR